MLAFPCMLMGPANEAGMTVPENPDHFNKEQYPHFFVFCQLQLGRSMSSPNQHWENAKRLVKISVEDLKKMTLEDFINSGIDMS